MKLLAFNNDVQLKADLMIELHKGLIMDDLIEQEEDEDNYCPACDGTGEGQYDGARCWQCKGKGTIQHSKEYKDEN